MAFQFNYEYTLDDMNALSRVTAKTYRKKKVLLYRLVSALLGAGYLAFGGMMLAEGSLGFGIVGLVLGLFFGAVALFYHSGAAWRSKRMMAEDAGELTAELEETGIRGRSQKGEDFYPYASFIGAYHYKGRYFLFQDKRHAVLLPDAGLVEGSAAELKSFLERKLGKTIAELR